MTHFAETDAAGTVLRVIVAEQWFVDKTPGIWVQTSYNTHGGVNSRGAPALRKNYAGKGYKYDAVRDAFIPPKPYPSWLLDEVKGQWKAPVKMPVDGKRYSWDESNLGWIEVTRA